VREDSNKAAACNEPVWDGPCRMTCRRSLVNGKCGRHGMAQEPGRASLRALKRAGDRHFAAVLVPAGG